MSQTCMCWGFNHGDGWFEIIWQLSLAIEEELRYSWLRKRWFLFKKSFFRTWNTTVYTLSPVRVDQRSGRFWHNRRPVSLGGRRKSPRDWLARNTFGPALGKGDERHSFLPDKHTESRGFKAFVVWPYTGFAVQQVKEKFGTLRFYCPGSDAIHKYVWLAERLSAVTCEDCGKPGNANPSGWIRTQCEDCRKRLAQKKDRSRISV
jgi:hypothetical protein